MKAQIPNSRKGGCLFKLIKLFVLVAVILCVAIYFSLGLIADYALKTVTSGTGIEAGVSSVSLGITDQKVQIKNFFITNPPNFKKCDAIAFKEALFDAGITLSDVVAKRLIVIDEIKVVGLSMNMDIKTASGLSALTTLPQSNISEIQNTLMGKLGEAKENDRYMLTRTLRANTGPVFLTVEDGTELDKIVEDKSDDTALFDFTADDGIRHTVWKISDPDVIGKITAIFGAIPCAYVADGHHRSASNARCARYFKSENPNHTGDEDYNWFLAVVFPAGQLSILPYNRVVRDLAGYTRETLLKKLSEICSVEKTESKSPDSSKKVSMYLDGQWYMLSFGNTDGLDAVSSLDVALLQDRILGPVLGIGDPRTDERIDFVGGIKGTGELERLVDSGKFAVAFSMYPTTVGQLMAIADAGQIMPPKSTWFEPKLRSGLFVHTF